MLSFIQCYNFHWDLSVSSCVWLKVEMLCHLPQTNTQKLIIGNCYLCAYFTLIVKVEMRCHLPQSNTQKLIIGNCYLCAYFTLIVEPSKLKYKLAEHVGFEISFQILSSISDRSPSLCCGRKNINRLDYDMHNRPHSSEIIWATVMVTSSNIPWVSCSLATG